VTTHPTRLTPLWSLAVLVLTATGLLLTVHQLFAPVWGGSPLYPASFLHLLIGLFAPVVLITRAPGRRANPVAWFDALAVAALVACAGYFAWHAVEIAEYGWDFIAPPQATAAALLYWGLVLEVLRRAAGTAVTVTAAVFSLYPLVAGVVPVEVLRGIDYDLFTLAQVHAMGAESIVGMPLQTTGALLVGFLCFGAVLTHTGGTDFFRDLSWALLGRFRGGSAKVAVASSASLGMVSGSAVSNVLTTGPVTIPAMIREGFSRRTAGAVEAVASTGGTITPPVMGTAAFLMASFAGVSYREVLLAAVIPAVLFFLGLFVHIDGLAAAHGMRGRERADLPRLRSVLVSGRAFLAALGLLTALLFTDLPEGRIPFLVAAALLLHSAFRRPLDLPRLLLRVGHTVGQIIGIMAGVGLILGGLSATGVALSLARDMVALVGDNLLLMLLAGAATCFVLGMGLTVSAAYVLLAIVLVPGLLTLGVDPLAAHLFVIYWASVSYLTPPVALAAFAAAGISGARPLDTALEATRLGAVKYLLPFGFVLNPALVAQGEPAQVAAAVVTGAVGVIALAVALSGRFGSTLAPLWVRGLLGVGGGLLLGPPGWLTALGAALLLPALTLLAGKRRPLVVQRLR